MSKEPAKLNDFQRRALRDLIWTGRMSEIRCPRCYSFHRKDCSLYESLRSAFQTLAPDVYDEIKTEMDAKK